MVNKPWGAGISFRMVIHCGVTAGVFLYSADESSE